jgi:hypothetical protein
MGMNTRTLHLHIDRIVVEGLPASRQHQFVRALEGQLTQMAENGLDTAFTRCEQHRIASLNAGQLRPGATAEQAAAQVVNSLTQSISAGGEARKHG